MKRPPPCFALLLFLGGAPAAGLLAADPQAAQVLRPAHLNVVASELPFGTVNPNDATGSMWIRADQVDRIRGFQSAARVDIVRSAGRLLQCLKEREANLLVLDTPDHLALAGAGLLEALAAGPNRCQLGATSYLLLNKDCAAPPQVDKLRCKKVAVFSRTNSNMGLVSAETLLAGNRLERSPEHFGSVEIVYPAQGCVLPLFFGKIDAGGVDSANHEPMHEVDQQLSRLRVLARCERLVGLFAMPAHPHEYRRELFESNRHETAAGDQLGMIFKTGPLVRDRKEQFDSPRSLIARYRHLVDALGDSSERMAWRLESTAGKERQ